MKQNILKINSVSKSYKNRRNSTTNALINVSFELNSSEIVGLIGPNGAGKTTLLRIIMGFEQSDSGSVEFLGKSTMDLDVRDKIGYQSDLQFRSNEFTVYNYLKFHSELYGISDYNILINSLLKDFSLSDSSDKKLSSLSKGMRQKVELILAFLNNPQLIILDEPTAALDPPSVFELRDFIKKFKNNGATILFSSHHLTEVEKVCDRVIFIDSGSIISDILVSEAEPGYLEESFRKYESERKFL
jgi:ABC-2 type transport system ATP-binding protein